MRVIRLLDDAILILFCDINKIVIYVNSYVLCVDYKIYITNE